MNYLCPIGFLAGGEEQRPVEWIDFEGAVPAESAPLTAGTLEPHRRKRVFPAVERHTPLQRRTRPSKPETSKWLAAACSQNPTFVACLGERHCIPKCSGIKTGAYQVW